jgi:hypothetical protein
MLSASFILLSLLTAAEPALALSQQLRAPATVLDDALRSKISQLVTENGVPGLAVGLLRVGAEAEVEFGSWGNRTEAGAQVDENVRRSLSLCYRSEEIINVVFYRQLFLLARCRRRSARPRWA